MKRKHFSLRFSLSTAITLIVLIIVLGMGIGIWININFMVRNSIEQRLRDTMMFAVTQIKAEDHVFLQSSKDENSPLHKKLIAASRAIKAINSDIRYVYTMRRNASGEILFVLDSEYGLDQDYLPIGSVYTDVNPEILAFFEHPEPVRILNKIYTDKWGTWLTGLALIKNSNGSIDGVIGIDISAAQIAEYRAKYLKIFGVFLAAVLLFSLILGYFIARRISRPIYAITEDMKRIRSLELQNSANLSSSISEVVEMNEALENMKKGLRSFRKFVPTDLVNELISRNEEAVLGSERKEISVFFSDIKNFTTISEGLPPEKLAQMLGVYFEGMTGTLQSHHATVDKYIGDSIMAFWNAPSPDPDHAANSCRAALSCKKFLDDNRSEWRGKGMPDFRTRIGINTGEAVVGNMGYENRLSYTALGDTVNLASRLESLNRHYDTDILVNESTYELTRDVFVYRLLDTVAVMGRSTGCRIYELCEEKGKLDTDREKWIESYNEAMELYFHRDWINSKKILRGLFDKENPDHSLRIIYSRIVKFQHTPPPDNWNGVVVMKEK